jgi:hypothetical protein
MAHGLAQRRSKKKETKKPSPIEGESPATRNAYVFLISRAAVNGFRPDAVQPSRRPGAMRETMEWSI